MENYQEAQAAHPLKYLKMFFRRRWFLLGPLFAGLTLGIAAVFILPPIYESSTLILVEEEEMINPLIQGLAVSTNIAQRMRTIKEQIVSWNSLVELTKKLDLATEVHDQAQFEKLILDLRKNISVQLRGNNIIRISYTGKTPQETLKIAKAMTDVLIEENMRSQTKEADVAIGFIKEQLDVYKRKIKESEIAEMQEQLKGLLADSTEQHPLVKDLRAKINKAQKELQSGEYKISGFEQPEPTPVYKALKNELDKITKEQEAVFTGTPDYTSPGQLEPGADPNASMYKIMLMDKLDSVLARDMRVNESIYNMLLQKLETAKITQRLEASKEGTRYSIIDPARLPLRPVKPNKPLTVLIGLFLGTSLGIGLVIGREFFDESFLDIDEAKQVLEDVPVLGGISRLTTQEEKDKERGKRVTLIALFIIIAFVIITSAVLFSFFRG